MPRKKTEKKSGAPKASRKTPTRAKIKSVSKIPNKTKRKARTSGSPVLDSPVSLVEAEMSKQGLRKAGFQFRLPRYSQTQVVVFVRDPHCLFTYWEISPEREEEVRKQMGPDWLGGYRVLRLLGVISGPEEGLLQEILVHPDERNRYIHLDDTGGEFYVEVGWKSPVGRYLAFARSGKITTAPGRLSDVIDKNWEPSPGLMEYFSEEESEDQPRQGPSSASMGQIRGLKKRGLGPGRLGASWF